MSSYSVSSLSQQEQLADHPLRFHRPKIQRLVTPERLQRRRHLRSLARRKTEVQKAQVEEYNVIVAKRQSEKKESNTQKRAAKRAVAQNQTGVSVIPISA